MRAASSGEIGIGDTRWVQPGDSIIGVEGEPMAEARSIDAKKGEEATSLGPELRPLALLLRPLMLLLRPLTLLLRPLTLLRDIGVAGLLLPLLLLWLLALTPSVLDR